MEYIILWSSAGIMFLILEFFTATTYGLGLAIGSFLASIYVWITGIEVLDIWQILIFGLASIGLDILFFRLSRKSSHPLKLGLEAYVGKTTTLVKNEGGWKVKLDGVEYLVTAETKQWFRDGKEVTISGVDGTTLIVDKLA